MPNGLSGYLKRKAEAMRAAAVRRPSGNDWRETVEATCVADDESGARKLGIRDWSYVSDSGADFGGSSLGPSSPELFCGVVSTCLTHTYLIAAASFDVPLERVEVRVAAGNNDARFVGLATDDPALPFDLTAFVKLEAPEAAAEALAALDRYVEERCPLTKLIREPGEITFVRED